MTDDLKREVFVSDLSKIADALREATGFFKKRDEMNAAVHLAHDVRYSPITHTVEAAYERALGMIAP
jgi:hypothetical protein